MEWLSDRVPAFCAGSRLSFEMRDLIEACSFSVTLCLGMSRSISSSAADLSARVLAAR